jgi:hypothetical protein
MIAEAVKKAMRQPSQKIQLRGAPEEAPCFTGGSAGQYCYFRVPVSQAIPLQQAAEERSNDRWRDSNKIRIRSVTL